jgi:hypothetical protein
MLVAFHARRSSGRWPALAHSIPAVSADRVAAMCADLALFRAENRHTAAAAVLNGLDHIAHRSKRRR